MTANDYLKSIQDNFDGIEKNLDKLSKKEIDTMLNDLAEGEDDVDFEREKREKILEESEEVEREYDTMYYPQVDGITPTVVAEPVKGDLISRRAVLELVADYDLSMGQVVKGIHALPLVNSQPKTGHWIMPVQDDGMSDPMYYQVRCSKCGFDLDPQTWHMELHQYDADKYCPKCGTPMIEPQESEEV